MKYDVPEREIMSIHIGAKEGAIASKVLMPGDPLRAKHIAETALQHAHCHSEVRNMLGYTGQYKGQPVSVQSSGMGIPSMLIYAHELIADYGVKTLIRLGTCGALQDNVAIGDVILAATASTDSQIYAERLQGVNFAPPADFELLQNAKKQADGLGLKTHVGGIVTTDIFYHQQEETWKKWADHGVLAIEMETAALYYLAARFRVRALSILTVTDHLVSKDRAKTRYQYDTYEAMIRVALEC